MNNVCAHVCARRGRGGTSWRLRTSIRKTSPAEHQPSSAEPSAELEGFQVRVKLSRVPADLEDNLVSL